MNHEAFAAAELVCTTLGSGSFIYGFVAKDHKRARNSALAAALFWSTACGGNLLEKMALQKENAALKESVRPNTRLLDKAIIGTNRLG